MALSDRLTKKIIALNIDLIGYKEAIEKIVVLAKNKTSAYVCFANVHMTIEAYEDESFASQVNNANLVLADGMPLVKAIKLFYGKHQDRIAGMDVMADVIKSANDNGLKIFFFGSSVKILKKIKTRIVREFPEVQIAGLVSPSFNQSLDDESYINNINKSEANLVFVALGCPKQEKWMARHTLKINAVLLGVGGAFPVYAGETKRAPLVMRNAGLEWMYRLFQEPKRLLKRYLKTNSLFVYLMIKTLVSRKK